MAVGPAPRRPHGYLWRSLSLLTVITSVRAERPLAAYGHAGSSSLELVRAPPESPGEKPALEYSKAKQQAEELGHVTDSYKENTIAVDAQAAKAKQGADQYAQDLRGLVGGHDALQVGLARLRSTVGKQNEEYMEKVKEVLSGAKGGNSSNSELENELVDEKDVPALAQSDAITGNEATAVAGKVDSTINNDGTTLKNGNYKGDHFRLELRWKGKADLDLHMALQDQEMWQTDKVAHINWAEPCNHVFCIDDDQRGHHQPDHYNAEVIYLRDNWQEFSGTKEVPNGFYRSWVMYYTAEPGSREPVAPPANERDEEIEYEASLFLGAEFGGEDTKTKVGACRGTLKWSDDKEERSKALFLFKLNDGHVTGLTLEEAPPVQS